MYLGLSLLVKTCASLLLFPVTHTLHKAQLLTLQAFQLQLCIQVCITWRQNVREKSFDLARFQIEMQCKRIHNTYVIGFLPIA